MASCLGGPWGQPGVPTDLEEALGADSVQQEYLGVSRNTLELWSAICAVRLFKGARSFHHVFKGIADLEMARNPLLWELNPPLAHQPISWIALKIIAGKCGAHHAAGREIAHGGRAPGWGSGEDGSLEGDLPN